MDFELSEEQKAYQASARKFADEEMLPFVEQWDQEHIFPMETLKKAAQLGFAGLYVKEDVGGTHLKRLDAAIIFEELATACPSTAAYLSIHNMVSALIDQYASNDLRKKWLPLCSTMEVFTSYCLTEPSSGSDAASLKTTAKREKDDYILNGAKAFISGGSVSDLYICMARTGQEGPKGISCFLIEKNTPGLSFGKREKKLGWHSQPTTMVFFENCKIPAENRIGQEGEGFKIALSALDGGRINIAACSLGGAKKCLQLTQEYMQSREQFKTKLKDFEALQFKFSELLTQFQAAKLMVYQAACAIDQNTAQKNVQCAMAKYFATDICFNICDEALQIFGGYGYLQDYPIERYLRDLRVHRILEGTNEIMKLIIARNAFTEHFNI